MEFCDLQTQRERIKHKIDAGIQRVLAHGKFILGPLPVYPCLARPRTTQGVAHNGCSGFSDSLPVLLEPFDSGLRPTLRVNGGVKG
jgi:hypothetical protein